MDNWVTRLTDASLKELQRIFHPFLLHAEGFDVKCRDGIMTVMYRAISNQEPDGYGSDIRKVFRESECGGYLISNPFQVSLEVKPDDEANSICSEFLLTEYANAGTELLLFFHPKIGLRLIHVMNSAYQIRWSKDNSVKFVKWLAQDVCVKEDYSIIETVMDVTLIFAEQHFETATELVDQITVEINNSNYSLCENDGFKRILAKLIGLRTICHKFCNTPNSNGIFLTNEQLACVDSTARVQLIHGGRHVGKTTALLLKLFNTARQGIKDIAVITRNEKGKHELESVLNFGGLRKDQYAVHSLNEESDNSFEFPLDLVKKLNSEWIFIDDVASISHNARAWLVGNKKIHVVCIFCNIVPPGLQQSKEWFQWIHLSGLGVGNEAEIESVSNNSELSDNSKPTVENDYFSWSMFTMKLFYPNWINGSSTTICIPASLDIIHGVKLRNKLDKVNVNRGNSKEENAKYGQWSEATGQKSEINVLQAFQRLNIGGILVANFSTRKFWNKIRDTKHVQMKTETREEIAQFLEEYGDFESDLLFFHPYLGIVVIEVKSAKKLHKRAEEQLEQMIQKKIPALFPILTGEELKFPISGVHCYPNADFPLLQNTQSCWIIINKTIIEDETAFRAFWLERVEVIKAQGLNFFEDYAFQRFICAIVAYRSSAVISHAINALEIYDILDTQQFMNTKPMDRPENRICYDSKITSLLSHRIKLNENQERTFFLNNEQLEVYESEMKPGEIEIICGPPGTGKTLLTVLLALKAGKEKRPGRVLIKAKLSLVPKLRLMVKNNRTEGGREIVVIDTVFEYQDDQDDDDYFADEMVMPRDQMKFLKRCSCCTGRTVVTITGAMFPSHIPKIRETFTAQREFKCVVHELRQVIRGTQHIVDFWKPDLPEYDFSMGHSAVGRPIELFRLNNSSLILKTILDKVESYLAASNQAPSSTKFGPTDLAIIVPDAYCAEYVKSFLASHGILCGSILEQLNDNNLIAIVKYDDALSYEWPVVLVVDFLLPGLLHSFKIISSSRAIAHLIYIERDLNHIQSIIHQKFNSQFTSNDMEVVGMQDIQKLVMITSQELGETESMITFLDYLYFVVCIGFMPQTLRSIEPFKNCSNLFDLLNCLADNKYLLHAIAIERTETDRKLLLKVRREGHGRIYLTFFQVPSKLFDKIFMSEMQRNAVSHFLDNYAKVLEVLTREQDQQGSLLLPESVHSTLTLSEERTLLELNQNAAWNDIKMLTDIIARSCLYYAVLVPTL